MKSRIFSMLTLHLIAMLAMLVALGMRARQVLQFGPDRQSDALALLDRPAHRQSALEAFHRAPPAEVLDLLEDPVHSRVYLDAVTRGDSATLDPGGVRRAACLAAAAAERERSPAEALVHLAIAGRLGAPLDVGDLLSLEPAATKTQAGLAGLAAALAAADQPGCADAIDALWRRHAGAPAASLQARIDCARALASLGDARAVEILVPGLTQTGKRVDERRVRHELMRMTASTSGLAISDWQGWLDEHRNEELPPQRGRLLLSLNLETGTQIMLVICLICYLTLVWIGVDRRWTSASGAIVLATAVTIFLRSVIGEGFAVSDIPFTPYADNGVSHLVDTVLLPYHAILFSLLAAFTPWNSREGRPRR